MVLGLRHISKRFQHAPDGLVGRLHKDTIKVATYRGMERVFAERYYQSITTSDP